MQTQDSSQNLQKKINALKESVITVAVESWLLFKVLERLLKSLDVKEQQRYQSKIRWFMKKTEESLKVAELKVVNYEGQPYDPGVPASPINIEDFGPDDKLYIIQMLEPVIIDSDGKVVKTGTVTLGRFE